MSGLVLLAASCICLISSRNGYAGLLVPSLPISLEPLAYHRNVASLSLLYRYYFGRCISELAELVRPLNSGGMPTCYSNRLLDFSATIPRC